MEQLKSLLAEHISDQLVLYREEDYEDAYRSFKNHFPDNQISDLQLIKNRTDRGDEIIVFRLDGNLVCFNANRRCDKCHDSCFWYTVNKMIVSSKGIYKIGNMDYDVPELIPGSSDRISYEVYPFEQGDELTLSELGLNECSLPEPNYFEEDEDVNWSNDLTLRVGENDKGITYSIYDGDKFISGLCDPSYSLQLGDAFSASYRYGNDLVIRNCGDVSSVVIIKLA